MNFKAQFTVEGSKAGSPERYTSSGQSRKPAPLHVYYYFFGVDHDSIHSIIEKNLLFLSLPTVVKRK